MQPRSAIGCSGFAMSERATPRQQRSAPTRGARSTSGVSRSTSTSRHMSNGMRISTLPFKPAMAATTLRELALRQGTRRDDFRDEDPGRILHEMRYGEMTAFEERPHSPYFGNADATPLFVVLLDEYERWTGDTKLVRSVESEARAALRWCDTSADLQGNGYISYKRRNEETGLENQC